jgi:hypothetical protein
VFLQLFAKTATAYGVRVEHLVERSRYAAEFKNLIYQ